MHDRGIGPHKTQFRRDENYGTFKFILLHTYVEHVDILEILVLPWCTLIAISQNYGV